MTVIILIWLAGFVVAWGYERETDWFGSWVDGYLRAIFWPIRLGIVVWDELADRLKAYRKRLQ